VEKISFIFWEAIKVLSLALLALLAAKAVASLPSWGTDGTIKRPWWVKGVLYSAILILVLLGAWNVGHDVAAESYLWASQDNMEHSQFVKAYTNALRAVRLRPGVVRYWRALVAAKVYLQQFESALDDLPALQAVNDGELDEKDSYRFAACYFFLVRYDKAISLTQQLIRDNRFYASPYVLQGMAYTALRKYSQAEQTFLAVLQMFPDHQAAVEGLAHAYFLAGNRARALAVLNETTKYHFSPEAKKRFEALKGLYGQ